MVKGTITFAIFAAGLGLSALIISSVAQAKEVKMLEELMSDVTVLTVGMVTFKVLLWQNGI